MTQVSMMSVRLLAAALEHAGQSAGCLAELGLSATRIQDVHARIPLAEYRRAVRTALAASRDPALGLHIGERANFGSYDVLGYLSAESSCLREALTFCQRYTRVVKDGPQLELHETSDTAIVRMIVSSEDSLVQRLTCEFAQLGLLTLVRHYVGEDAQPLRVLFGYRAPAYRVEYSRLFAGREQFSQAFTGMELPRSWLSRGHVCRSPELCAWLEMRANQLLVRAARATTTTDRVRDWLTAHKDIIRPTMEEVAHDLGVSSRSLRRHLRLEAVTFEVLVAATLAERAKQLLGNPDCSVQEVAYELGYHTPSAFSRAFKRWTGEAPSAFRLQCYAQAHATRDLESAPG